MEDPLAVLRGIAERAAPPTPLQRDEAIRKVAAFLKANYPCDCGDDDCDELDEAATIVEIVERSMIP